jgi:hypothetical protein
MWFSFWVTVCFGVVFALVEIALSRPLPFGVGVIPAAAVSIATNGWEGIWNWRFHYHGKLCVEPPGSGASGAGTLPVVEAGAFEIAV